MPKEQNPSYVMNEELSHPEKQKNRHTEHDSSETLKSFHHNVSHLDAMIRKVNDIDRNSIKNADTVDILNTLLQKSGIGGINGWKESKAYFTKHGEHIVLVLNTVVDGERLSSIGDVRDILVKVDELLVKNPADKEISGEKREAASGEKIHRANVRLAQYEKQIQETNSSYRENTNDFLMAADAVVDIAWGMSGKKIYENAIRSIQKNIETDYKSLFASFSWKELTTEDMKKLDRYKARAEELLGKKLENVQSFTGYLLTEKKLDSVKNAAYAAKGMAEWAFDAFVGTAVFAYAYSTHPEVRDSIHASVGSFYDYLKENYSDHDKLWKDFLKAFDKEFEKFHNLPSEQQAEAIGKITGNVIATIIGAKATNMAVKSGKLRLKFKSPESGPFRSVEPATGIRYMSGKSASVMSKRHLNAITDIGEVKTWADLESFVSTIDRVRFKKWVTGKVIQEIIDDARQGLKDVSEVPDYGGIRKAVQKLKENGGTMPEPVGMKQKTIHSMEQMAKKGMENAGNILPFKEARKFLQRKILTWYDYIDVNIANLRTLTNKKVATIGNGIAEAAHLKEIADLTEKTIANIRSVSFPGKETLLDNLTKMQSSLAYMKEKWTGLIDATAWKIADFRWKLTKKELQALRFEEGFAVREIKKDGVTFYEYRNADGKKLLDEYTYASHFKDGKASVTTKDGKNFTIDTTGKVLTEHTETFASIQRFENGGHRVFEDGYYRIVYPEGHKGSKANYKSWKYAFMTEVRGDMVIGVDTKGVKYVIDQNRNRFRTPFHYIDDFTEHGVAAVREGPNGKWLLIDKEGNLLRKDGSMIRGTGEIIDKDGNILNRLGGKWSKGKFDGKMAQEAREAAFKEEWYETNLEAIKAHMKKVYRAGNPELMRKVEIHAMDVLKQHNIHNVDPRLLSHTQREGIILYEDPVKGTRIVNLETEMVSKESFFYVHTPDLDNGFLRVSPLKDGGDHMGVVNLRGEYIVPPKYTDIQIHDEAKKLFKVSETRNVGEVLADGTKIGPHASDIPGSQTVERLGLVDGRGNVLIETGYTEITNTNDIMAQGLVRWDRYQILHESKKYNIEKHSTNITSTSSGSFDTASFVAMTATNISAGEKAGKKSIGVLRNETSTIVSELKSTRLSLFISGTAGADEVLPMQMQAFLQKAVPAMHDIGMLEEEIGKMIHRETKMNVKRYLEKNEFSELTKVERMAVAGYEKEMREKFIWAIREQVRGERILPKWGKLSERERFMDALANKIHPDLYRSLGGTIREGNILKKAA